MGVRGYEATIDGSDFDEAWTEDVAKSQGRITDVGLYPVFPARYNIFKVGSTYYRRDGETGIVDDSNADAKTLIQDAVDIGGLIHLRGETDYLCSDIIDITTDNVIFEGEGYNTVLKCTNDGLNTLLAVSNADNVIVRQLQLDGDSKAHTLLFIGASGGSTTEYTSISDIWMHDNKPGINRSILWAWDLASGYNIKNLYLNNIYGWNIDTGANDYDNIAFTYVDGMVISNSIFNIERTLIFYYTRHARAYNVEVDASEYRTFVVDGSGDDILLKECISRTQPAMLLGTKMKVDGGYYYNSLHFGEVPWYAGDIVINKAYLTGGTPLSFYGRRLVVRDCRLLSTNAHCIDGYWSTPTMPEYVLLEGNEIDNANIGAAYCIIIRNAERVVAKNNHLIGTGKGISFDNTPFATLRGNWFDGQTLSEYLDLGGSWAGTLDLPTIKEPFIHFGGGSGGWDVTYPWGIDIDADNEVAFTQTTLPPNTQLVYRVTMKGYSNVAEAVNNMLLRLNIQGAGSSEAFNTHSINVVNKPSVEEGGIAINDAIHWMIDDSDSITIRSLAAGDNLQIYAYGEAAVAPDIITDALFGTVIIEYL